TQRHPQARKNHRTLAAQLGSLAQEPSPHEVRALRMRRSPGVSAERYVEKLPKISGGMQG
ncbi:MAG: hypothetical protein ACYDFQ_02935, partial [Vulcanimicrobiaceae bacterium]